MGATIAIASPQNRVRDCYAAAPNLDLTLRSNGEEGIMIMDSFGVFTQAGFDPPTVAPVLTLGTAGSGLTTGTWVGYIYVYAAKTRYPLVDAGTSAGGSIAPRSNPSPSANINIIGIGGNPVNVVVATSSRPDISDIWLYRTEYFLTQQEAIDAVNAGTAFYIAEIVNNPNLATITYIDSTLVAAGEECDTDNFTAPQFRYCQYFDPYFYGFGNDALVHDCSVNTDGSFGFVTLDYKLFDGRNGQLVSFIGITTGGFDGHGNFYFLHTSDYVGRCMLDQDLTQFASLDFTGTTQVTIKGPSNILYRSKPHNPLSWGDTTIVNNIRVPAPYTFKIGGGYGTAISIIPNLNLLKLDTIAPGVSYVLNLRLAGSPAFEASKRELSRGFSVSNHFAQFPTLDGNGNIVLWGFDFKSSSILQCDGSSQIPISSKIFDSLRLLNPSIFNHGIYDDHTELAAFWFSTGVLGTLNNLAILYHVPTGNWSTHIDFDVSCSDTIFDSFTDENKTVVGTSTGLIGQALLEDSTNNWLQGKQIYNKYSKIATNPGADFTFIEVNLSAPFDITTPYLWVGQYIRILPDNGNGAWINMQGAICKIIAIPDNNTMDIKIVTGSIPGFVGQVFAVLGYIPTQILKYTQLNSPAIQKQLTEMFLTSANILKLEDSTHTGWTFDYGIELELFNVFANITNNPLFHLKYNDKQAFYNQFLNTGITFTSILGLQIDLIAGTLPIEIKDYSLVFNNG